jgi:hypothetical protein
MTKSEQIAKTRAAVQGLLALLRKKVGRTELTKLLYLADNLFYESRGRTITGNTYMWDHYGPNAVSNAVISEADELVIRGVIRMAIRPSAYGGSAYEYWVDAPNETWEDVASRLDAGECQVLMDIVNQFRRTPLSSLIKHAKATPPFVKAQQYDILQLEQIERASEMQKQMDSCGELIEEVKLGLKDTEEGHWVWDEDLDTFTRL